MTHSRRPLRHRILAIAAGAALVAPLLAACQGAGETPTVNPSLDAVPPISFGVLRAPGGALAAVSGEEGWFADAGIEVQFESFAEGGGPAVVQAMAGGTPDVAIVNAAPVVLALGQDTFDMRIVSVASDASRGTQLLMVPGIESVEDLRGKRVSVPKGGGQYYLLASMLAKYDMTFDDIDYRPLAVGDAQAAFLTGQLDAVISSANGTVTIKKNMPDVNGLAVDDVFDADDNYSSPDVIIATKEAVENNPEGVARFARAYHDSGIAYLNDPETHDAAIQKIQDYMLSAGAGVDDLDATEEAVSGYDFLSWEDGQARLTSPELLAALDKQAQFWLDNGVIPTLPDFSKAIAPPAQG